MTTTSDDVIGRLRGGGDRKSIDAINKAPPRHRKGEKFLKGPIPWPWLELALPLPGRAIHVALHLWLEAGFARSKNVSVSLRRIATAVGCGRATASRGLEALASAGLVTVHRLPGRKPRVTLHNTPQPHE